MIFNVIKAMLVSHIQVLFFRGSNEIFLSGTFVILIVMRNPEQSTFVEKKQNPTLTFTNKIVGATLNSSCQSYHIWCLIVFKKEDKTTATTASMPILSANPSPTFSSQPEELSAAGSSPDGRVRKTSTIREVFHLPGQT